MVIRKEDGGYCSWCPELDVASQGDSVEEARDNLKEAVELYVETMVEDGEIKQILAKLGITKENLKRERWSSESLSGNFQIPLEI